MGKLTDLSIKQDSALRQSPFALDFWFQINQIISKRNMELGLGIALDVYKKESQSNGRKNHTN